MIYTLTKVIHYSFAGNFFRVYHIQMAAPIVQGVSLTTSQKNLRKSVTRQQGLNAACADYIWKFSPLNGFNYQQLASTHALVR